MAKAKPAKSVRPKPAKAVPAATTTAAPKAAKPAPAPKTKAAAKARTKPVTPTTSAKAATLDAAALSALASFARGYLHQDLTAEYADAPGATVAFCLEASAEERAALAADLARLIDGARGWPPATLARFFTNELRAAWTPSSLADVHTLADVVRGMS